MSTMYVVRCVDVSGVRVSVITAYRTAKRSLLNAAPVTAVSAWSCCGSLASARAKPSHCSVAADQTATFHQ